MSVKIFGVGNPLLCDDGIGLAVVHRMIQPENSFIYESEIFVQDYIEEITVEDMVILIDAMDFEQAPGEIHVMSFIECRNYLSPELFGHDAGLLYSLIYEKQHLNGYVIGIQVEQICYHIGISRTLQERLEQIVQQVNKEVAQICTKLH